MTLPRRDFLGLAGATGLLAATGSPLSADTAGTVSTPLSDVQPHDDAHSARAEWDMSWVERVKGKHRAVFDSPIVSEGGAVFRAVMWIGHVKEVYKVENSDINAIVVLRHEGTILAMNDEYWQKYDAAKEFKIEVNGQPATKNPITGTGNYSLQNFIAQGGIALVCGVAFSGAVSKLRRALNVSREEADTIARSHMLPGTILQPSGIFGALAAQQAGCNYIMGS